MSALSNRNRLAASHPGAARTAQPAVPDAAGQLPLPLASRAVLLTPDQAADLLGVSARVLERWRGSGDGPQYAHLSRRSIRYRVEDLEAFVSSSLRANTAQGGSRVAA